MRIKQSHYVGIGLQLFAIALANWQLLGGVRTDEAKYLLNVAYPHPPLLRWIMSMTEILPFQEFLWRLLLASLLIHAVWIVWDMTRTFHLEDRMMVCAGWLFSTAVIIQAGSVMMAPVMAVQALALLWLRTRSDIVAKRPIAAALLWLATLFTSYPGVLLLPITWDVFRRGKLQAREVVIYTLAPVALLAVYTLGNPLAVAIMAVHKNEGVSAILWSERLLKFTKLWIIGGAGIAGAVGTWGILRGLKDKALIASFLLVCAYVFFSITPLYYAIFFTPFFVGGLWNVFHERRHPHAFPLLACLVFASAVVAWFVQLERVPGPARDTMAAIGGTETGTVLISGTFGHEWQYESRMTVRRYKPEFAKDASAVVCLNKCEPMFDTTGWKRLTGVSVETWIRK